MNIPNRSSDAGPKSRRYCGVCGSSKWSSLGDCVDCGDKCCDECPDSISTTKGIYCAKCICKIVHELDPADWPELMPVEEIEAVVRYAQIPEWQRQGNGWVN